MRTLKTTEILISIAKREGLNRDDVREIIHAHFDFIKHVQHELVCRKTNFFPTVRVPNFAAFYIPSATQERLAKYNNKQNEAD